MSCHQLVWTAPVAAPAPAPWNHYEFESTAQITEIDDDGPPPLVDAPCGPPPPGEFILFPPPTDEEASVTKRSTHSKKKPENHIPRPPNAFILFRSSFIKSQHVSQEVETNHSTLSKIIGLTWKNLSDSERKTWHDKAKEELEKHRRKFPKYAFRPQQAKGVKGGGTGVKRKVREVEPKDLKRCAKIAELLVQGKKGSQLDAEIAEFDKHHVPEIVTRFEAPITEQAYRRSSSAPIPDTELAIEQQSFLPKEKTPAPRKIRSVSQRPTRASTPLVAKQPTVVVPQQQQQQQEALSSPLEETSSFDFSSFSFENVASPVSSYSSCDPLAESFGMQPQATFNDAALTIDTSSSYMSGDWSSQCSSPVTPHASPEFLSTPSPSPTFSADHFGHAALEKSFVDYSQQQYPIVYQEPSFGEGLCGDAFLSMASGDFGSFDLGVHQAMVPLDQYGMDAFSFNTVPQYAF